MAGQNTYLTYKRETAELLYWIIQASNSIIQKTGARDEDGLSLLNTTGKTTVNGLVCMAKLIAEHIGEQTVPLIIFRLFQSVIEAREATHEFFVQVATASSDPEIDKSNDSHKHFISALKEAWKALSGVSEASKAEADAELNPATPPERVEDHDPNPETLGDDNNVIHLANKFASLYLGSVDEEDDDDEEGEEGEKGAGNGASEGPPASASVRKSRKKSHSKGKKKIRGRKSKYKKNPMKPAVPESTLESIPIESYRIIEDKEGIMTDYLIATYSLTVEWMSLRSFLQQTWKEVAYDGLNSAVAGTLSNMAISMLKRSELAMHVDFPGHDTFHTVVNTITRGEMGNTQDKFKLPKFQLGEQTTHETKEVVFEVKEQFMIHAYNDLFDFLRDFQTKRNGRPTKSMLAEVDKWDPSFDLQQATPEERLRWRRSYTINWLYDLVNVFSVAAVHKTVLKGLERAPEEIDWSMNGFWNEYRRIFGLREFAREVTFLAMQKQGTDVRSKIHPHMVFQLQCIVDSLMVSHGFQTDVAEGQVLSQPARQFRPGRDVDLFLDRIGERGFKGYMPSVNTLAMIFENASAMNRCPISSAYAQYLGPFMRVKDALQDWLGKSSYIHGFHGLPPSRFSNTNTNGLWEYSPFLCGVGLMEGLDLAYQYGLMLFDRSLEPFVLVHLHNMLVQKGYITRPRGLYLKLQDIFTDAFFIDGKIPTSSFQDAMRARISILKEGRTWRRFRAKYRENSRGDDIQEKFDVGGNKFFKLPSALTLYRKAAWNHERVPDTDVNTRSQLAAIRLAETNIIYDLETAKLRLAETGLTRRLREGNVNEEQLVSAGWSAHQKAKDIDMKEARASSKLLELSQNLKTNNDRADSKANIRDMQLKLSSVFMLHYLKLDIQADICGLNESGPEPLSGINFVHILLKALSDFSEVEHELKKAQNPTYIEVYEADLVLMKHKRVNLAKLALRGNDEECLRIMAECLQRDTVDYEYHLYWD